MKAFQANLQRLDGAGTQVLGVSIDSPFANHAFAETEGIAFPLLGDTNDEVTAQYGLLKTMKIQEVSINSARRATFLIDKNGKIVEESVDAEAVDPTKIVEACDRLSGH